MTIPAHGKEQSQAPVDAGGHRAGKQLCRRGCRHAGGHQGDHKSGMHPCSQQSKQHPGLPVQERDLSSLLISGKAIPGLFWDSQYKIGSHRLIAMKMIKELEHLSHEKSLRELVLSAWRRLKGELIGLYIKTWWEEVKKLEPLICGVQRQDERQ